MVYPKDAVLCAVEIGGKLYHRPSVTAAALKEAYQNDCVSVRQGYARCAVCSVGRNAIITADSGIAGTAQAQGCKVLRISDKGFALEGFQTGFIGGSSFTDHGSRTVYFTGHLQQSPEQDEILRYIEKHGYQTEFLTDAPAFDIGSAILL